MCPTNACHTPGDVHLCLAQHKHHVVAEHGLLLCGHAGWCQRTCLRWWRWNVNGPTFCRAAFAPPRRTALRLVTFHSVTLSSRGGCPAASTPTKRSASQMRAFRGRKLRDGIVNFLCAAKIGISERHAEGASDMWATATTSGTAELA